MAGSSNVDELVERLKQFFTDFNFERPGVEESLGKDCAHAVAQAIADAAAEQRQTDGKPFPKNEKDYGEYKDRKYGVAPPAYGIRTGQMLSIQSLLGDVEVHGHYLVMNYGTGEAPTRSATGYITEADKAITDRQKAEYLTDHPQKPIDFYQAGDAGRAAVVEVIQEALDRAIAEFNSGGS